ncbi:F-box protein SKIP16 isoform X1 [Ziziphus jujuba]|uniref:F-box protein SKIP16 isoform X1 n=1 Tax=Ziziphus jujuba TaxID=326968 RepID=A0A6P4AM02_ZIZJJ|nr:F-box protein SKIP16 isoform X1 [Ziziphus jujuba]
MALESVGDLALNLILSKLEPEDTAKSSCVSKKLRSSASEETLWSRFCADELGLSQPIDPLGNPTPSFKICYQIWRKEFCIYPWSLVKRVRRCWDRLRSWLAVNFPEAGATLRKGATEDDIKELENALKVKLPLPTRVLYRFVDGQEFHGKDYITSVFGCPLGLIGGYIFYDQCVNVYMLPLRQVILETREIRRELHFPGKSKYVAVACSSTVDEKFFFLNCFNGQLYVGTQNLPHYGEMIPCVPDELIRSVHDCNGDQQQDATLLWLEEHVRRLESGIIKLCEYGNIKCISLFPEETPLCSTAITNGVKVRASAVFVPENANLKNDQEKYLFAYLIRMSLLPEGCIVNGMSFSSCQLHWRHWIIRANDTVTSDVNAEAVIGKFPLLKPGEEEFVYESCTPLTSSTGSVEGSFTFVPGRLTEPEGSSFEVAVARFPLQRPDYIF